MNWKYLLLFIAAAWGLQAVLTMLQMQNYRKRFSQLAILAKDGYLGAGSSAGRISAGVVVLLTTDASGKVTHAERMKGRTVFARFQPLPQILGANVENLAMEESAIPEADKNTRKAIKMAAELILQKINEHGSGQDALAGGSSAL